MPIKIRNCNNITSGEISLEVGCLNIKYAANGTGKSTIAKAIELGAANIELEKLTPFELLGVELSEDNRPEITGLDGIQKVEIFNDRYIEQFVFKQDEVLENSFQIFVKNEEYDQRNGEIENLLACIKNTFAEDASIDTMITDLGKLVSGFGKPTKTSSFSASSPVGKGIANGNKLENIPDSLTAYSDFLKSDVNSQWIKWQVSGAKFMEVSEHCPFCASSTADTKTTIELVGQEFDAKTIEHLVSIIDVLNELSQYFTEEANTKLRAITTNKATVSDEEKTYLGNIRKEVETLKSKVSALKSISFFQLKSEENLVSKIEELKIDLTYLPALASDTTSRMVGTLNSQLDGVSSKAGELLGKIRKHQNGIAEIIKENTDSINEFLADAGYKYKVKIEEKGPENSYIMTLNHEQLLDGVIDGKAHLSYGERNAFALVLFMHQVLRSKPDLVILDDPISSFDNTKKFAIAKRLFSTGTSLRDKTVLLLTHDFEPIVDAVYVLRSIFSNVRAFHLSNESGEITEREITRDDILSFPQICKVASASDCSLVIKAIYLRRYYEIMDDKADEYQLLSSLLHKVTVPYRKEPDGTTIALTEEEVSIAIENIQKFCPDFDYETILSIVQDQEQLLALYAECDSNYQKLQVFRMLELPTKFNSIFMKHVNESYHIENEYVMQIDPNKYQVVPSFIIEACDAEIAANSPVS